MQDWGGIGIAWVQQTSNVPGHGISQHSTLVSVGEASGSNKLFLAHFYNLQCYDSTSTPVLFSLPIHTLSSALWSTKPGAICDLNRAMGSLTKRSRRPGVILPFTKGVSSSDEIGSILCTTDNDRAIPKRGTKRRPKDPHHKMADADAHVARVFLHG